MCDLNNIKTNRRIGYKLLAIKKDKPGFFYSSFTGQRIKPGKVPNPPVWANRLTHYWNSDLDSYPLRRCYLFNPKFAGMTSAFLTKEDLYDCLIRYSNVSYTSKEYKLVKVKITFEKEVFLGNYWERKVICSSYIKNIEIIK